jgi:hypothetical protein
MRNRARKSWRFSPHSDFVVSNQPLGNATRFLVPLAFDCHRIYGVGKLRRFLDGQQFHASPDRRSGTHGRRKAYAIQSVVDAHSCVAHVNGLSTQMAQQRQGEKSVGNRPAVRRFARRTLRVDMNPLPICGCVRKFVDPFLVHDEPPGRRQFVALEFLQRA